MSRSPTTPPRGRRFRRAVVVAAAATLVSLVAGQPASAYVPNDAGGVCPDGIRFTNDGEVDIVVHIDEWASNGQFVDMAQAVSLVAEEFNHIGGTTAQLGTISLTYEAFDYLNWYGETDDDPKIHVGFVNSLGGTEIGEAAQPVRTATCDYNEAHIALLNSDTHDWNTETPPDAGEDYYDAGREDATGATWFRPVFLHELVHTFGLSHTLNSYAFMNYGTRPWANRAPDDMIRPLPDDARGLRHLYADTTDDRVEVAVLNTWHDPSETSDDGTAALQEKLCLPSLGDDFNSDPNGLYCGVGGTDATETDVCEDDLLKTTFALANYSTEAVDVTVGAWFSETDIYGSSDIVSPHRQELTIQAGHSRLSRFTVKVPELDPGEEYYVIIRARAETAGGDVYTDWIPLRGTVQYC